LTGFVGLERDDREHRPHDVDVGLGRCRHPVT
jgi:hypothetical protein